MKLWGGRFEKTTDGKTDDFHSSISFDKRLYNEDIDGSVAHARMLGKQGVIMPEEADSIISGLNSIRNKIESNEVDFDIAAEDIHMNIEKLLIDEIGDTGKKLHTARSRNDQVAVDMKMYVKKEVKEIIRLTTKLIRVLYEIAQKNINTIMPGYTHMQKAQPVTFAHHMGAYIEMFRRDIKRFLQCLDNMEECPLGAGALAGTTYSIDRAFTSETLGFSEVTQNSIDSVADRDYCIELLADISIQMMHLSRFCEEIIIWNTHEFGFIELDDSYSTGSSIMPQKKNPDMAELIRGKTGRAYGALMTLLTVMKGLPLAYNKDMQEDKEAVFDAIDTVKMCLPVFTEMIETMIINKERMLLGANGGFTNATDAADWLVKNGAAFRDAHEITGRLVLYAAKQGKSLDELTLEEYKSISSYFDESVFEAINVHACVNGRNVKGGPAPDAMNGYLKGVLAYLEQTEQQ